MTENYEYAWKHAVDRGDREDLLRALENYTRDKRVDCLKEALGPPIDNRDPYQKQLSFQAFSDGLESAKKSGDAENYALAEKQFIRFCNVVAALPDDLRNFVATYMFTTQLQDVYPSRVYEAGLRAMTGEQDIVKKCRQRLIDTGAVKEKAIPSLTKDNEESRAFLRMLGFSIMAAHDIEYDKFNRDYDRGWQGELMPVLMHHDKGTWSERLKNLEKMGLTTGHKKLFGDVVCGILDYQYNQVAWFLFESALADLREKYPEAVDSLAQDEIFSRQDYAKIRTVLISGEPLPGATGDLAALNHTKFPGKTLELAVDYSSAWNQDGSRITNKYRSYLSSATWQPLLEDNTVIFSDPEIKGCFIKVLTNSDQVREEADQMGHCVGDYLDQFKTGELHVLSFRNRDDTPPPLVTMGLSLHVGPCPDKPGVCFPVYGNESYLELDEAGHHFTGPGNSTDFSPEVLALKKRFFEAIETGEIRINPAEKGLIEETNGYHTDLETTMNMAHDRVPGKQDKTACEKMDEMFEAVSQGIQRQYGKKQKELFPPRFEGMNRREFLAASGIAHLAQAYLHERRPDMVPAPEQPVELKGQDNYGLEEMVISRPAIHTERY